MEKVILIIGETGHGKSTLMNGILDSTYVDEFGQNEVAPKAGNSKGTTKEMIAGPARADFAPGFSVKLYDSPGIGDFTIDTGTLLSKYEDVFDKRGIDAVIVCQKIGENFTQAMKMAIEVLNRGLVQERTDSKQHTNEVKKWENIILVGCAHDPLHLLWHST